jgi:DmsE family decaheme c-type cytochrome
VNDKHRFRISLPALSRFLLLGTVCLGLTACGYSHREGRRTDTYLGPYPSVPKPNNAFRQASYGVLRSELPTIADAEYINDDELCVACHKQYVATFKDNVHRGLGKEGQSCEACHGPCSKHVTTRGKEPGMLWSFKTMTPVQKSEACARCHEENVCAPGANWRTSVHAHNNVSCTDCHRGHYNVPPGTPATTEPEVAGGPRQGRVRLASYAEGKSSLPSLQGTSNNLDADAPTVCFKCHGDYAEYARIAGPHQICGPNNFNCTTCHDPHGKILEVSRKELCLSCHSQHSPTMAWHSSIHDLVGVSCTDCHNPHPRTSVQQVVGISHYGVNRPKRLMMSVQEPEACYKCHPKIYALNALPSHHPIKEGKMVCSDCHDPHNQGNGNLKADGVVGTVNLVCYRCHAEKQGPFAYEHPPVSENCGYCHDPHGTVTNKLLKQPPVFLCLRCHTGHRNSGHGGGGTPGRLPFNGPTFTASATPGARADIDRNPGLRQGFYSDCTLCHAQIHGSDLPSSHAKATMQR